MGLVPAEPGFLPFLREAADAAGALLVFDEVITGFRVAPGGVQERDGVLPDLTILGKVIGGGLPAAAYAGRGELMERVAPAGDVYQAGTLSGNPLATAAGLATLRLLDAAAYERLDRTTELLANGLAEAARDAGVPVQVPWTTGLLTVFFSEHPVRDLDGARACDAEAHARLLPRPAGAWRLPAAVAVRGLVPVARARRRAPRADARGRAERRSRRCEGPSRGGRRRRRLAAPVRRRLPGRASSSVAWPIRDRAFVLEAVREGYLLHYGEPRAFEGMDPDLRLLAGDALYALGLARLAARAATCPPWPSWPT